MDLEDGYNWHNMVIMGSVIVMPGCTLYGYPESDYGGKADIYDSETKTTYPYVSAPHEPGWGGCGRS